MAKRLDYPKKYNRISNEVRKECIHRLVVDGKTLTQVSITNYNRFQKNFRLIIVQRETSTKNTWRLEDWKRKQ